MNNTATPDAPQKPQGCPICYEITGRHKMDCVKFWRDIASACARQEQIAFNKACADIHEIENQTGLNLTALKSYLARLSVRISEVAGAAN